MGRPNKSHSLPKIVRRASKLVENATLHLVVAECTRIFAQSGVRLWKLQQAMGARSKALRMVAGDNAKWGE